MVKAVGVKISRLRKQHSRSIEPHYFTVNGRVVSENTTCRSVLFVLSKHGGSSLSFHNAGVSALFLS